MYSFSTVDFDLDGDVLVDSVLADNKVHDFSRRTSRAQTLDGGVVASDKGYASGDRTIKLALNNITEAEFINIKRLFKTYSDYVVCTPEAAFTAIGSSFRVARGIVVVTFLITGDA